MCVCAGGPRQRHLVAAGAASDALLTKANRAARAQERAQRELRLQALAANRAHPGTEAGLTQLGCLCGSRSLGLVYSYRLTWRVAVLVVYLYRPLYCPLAPASSAVSRGASQQAFMTIESVRARRLTVLLYVLQVHSRLSDRRPPQARTQPSRRWVHCTSSSSRASRAPPTACASPSDSPSRPPARLTTSLPPLGRLCVKRSRLAAYAVFHGDAPILSHSGGSRFSRHRDSCGWLLWQVRESTGEVVSMQKSLLTKQGDLASSQDALLAQARTTSEAIESTGKVRRPPARSQTLLQPRVLSRIVLWRFTECAPKEQDAVFMICYRCQLQAAQGALDDLAAKHELTMHRFGASLEQALANCSDELQSMWKRGPSIPRLASPATAFS